MIYGDGERDTARRMLPELPEACFVPAGAERLRAAARDGVAQVVLVAGMDEQVAVLDDAAALESITVDMGGGAVLAAEVAAAPTPRHAYGLWETAGKLGQCGRELCRRTAGELGTPRRRRARTPARSPPRWCWSTRRGSAWSACTAGWPARGEGTGGRTIRRVNYWVGERC